MFCSFFFVSLLHTTHLVHRCGKQWMRTKWCVCITPFVHLRYLPSSLLLLSFSSVFSVLSHFQSHHLRTFLLVFFWWPNHPSTRLCLLGPDSHLDSHSKFISVTKRKIKCHQEWRGTNGYLFSLFFSLARINTSCGQCLYFFSFQRSVLGKNLFVLPLLAVRL